MTSLAFLATAALALRLGAGAAPELPQGDIQVDAGSVVYEPGTGRYLLEGGAVVRRGDVVLRARAASFDPESGEVVATGDVLLTDRTRAISAEGVRAVLGGPFEAEGVVAFLKDGPVDLSAAPTSEAARVSGRNRLTLTGDSVRGDAAGRLALEGARLTLCDCAADHSPSWEIRARGADVVPGRRATFSWPVLYVTPRLLFVRRPVPVFVFPWLYLPLGGRQTGLLLPQVQTSGATGFYIAEPLYLTLGRSADLTLVPGYAFGRGRDDVARGERAVRGPSARLEVRWAPAADSRGQAELTWLDDLDAEPGGASGHRYAFTMRHAQRLPWSTSLRADVALYGDPVFPRDFTADLLARGTNYRRSDLRLTHARDLVVLEAGAAYLQPLRPGGVVTGERYGFVGREVDQLHRLPSLSATLLPVRLGPIRLEGRAGLDRFGAAGTLEGGFDGLFGWGPLPRAAGTDVAARPAATRGDVRAELAMPLVVRSLSVEPYVRGAALAYAFDADGGSGPSRLSSGTETAWALAGVRLGAEMGRSFGALRHRIAPRLEWRLGTPAAGDRPLLAAYDPLDRASATSFLVPLGIPDSRTPLVVVPALTAAPLGRFHQARLSLENRLTLGGAELLRVEVGQDLDVERGELAETSFAGAVRAGPFSADAYGRLLAFEGRPARLLFPDALAAPPSRSPLDRFTELRATAGVADRRGDGLRVGLLAVGAGASGVLVGGLDALFDLRGAPVAAVAQGTAGATLALGPARLAYDVLVHGRPATVQSCSDPASQRRVGTLAVQQHTASFSWDSPCRCFRFAAAVTVDACGRVDLGAITVELPTLGGAGVSR